MTDSYEYEFIWPHPEANSVIVTGTFDNWTQSLHLARTPTGFTAKASIPWDSKLLFKFIVDGNWIENWQIPTERDHNGNVNNVVYTPKKPEIVAAVVPPTGNGHALTEKEPITEHVPAPEPEAVVADTSAPVAEETELTPNEPEVEVKAEPVEVAPVVPVEIIPVKDAKADSTPEEPTVTDASTHVPVSVEEAKETSAVEPAEKQEAVLVVAEASETPVAATVAVPEPESKPEVEKVEAVAPAESEPVPESKPVEEPASLPERPSTPPPKADALEVPSLPATPTPAGKGTGVNGHARSATTATGMGMITPPASAPSTPKKAMSLAESDTVASPLGSDKRKKRLSFFGKIKAKLSPSKEKAAGNRRSSLSPSSPLNSPSPKNA